jgi:hypothetical protein
MPELQSDAILMVEDELTKSLGQTVYLNVSDSDYYENTFSLLDAVDTINVTQTSNNVSILNITGIINPTKMDYKYPSYGNNGSEDNTQNITNWLNNGHKGWYYGTRINYKGKKFIEKAQYAVNLKLKDMLEKKLKSDGYQMSK